MNQSKRNAGHSLMSRLILSAVLSPPIPYLASSTTRKRSSSSENDLPLVWLA
jgi:hypothetical protein